MVARIMKSCIGIILDILYFPSISHSNDLKVMIIFPNAGEVSTSAEFLFSKSTFFSIQEYHQSVCLSNSLNTQVRPEVLLGLIWVQTVCKDYQQTPLVWI